MRSFILWIIVWMVFCTVLAAGTPSFFPDWVQAATWAAGATGAVLLIVWAKHVEVLNTRLTAKDEDIKRLETKNAELGKQLQKEPTTLPQVVSSIKASEIRQETPKLKHTESSINHLTQAELKNKAAQMASDIHKIIEETIRQTGIPKTLLFQDLSNVTGGEVQTNIKNATLAFYRKVLCKSAVELKQKSDSFNKQSRLPLMIYKEPGDLRGIEEVAKDLERIAKP